MRRTTVAMAAMAALLSIGVSVPADAQYPGYRYGRSDDAGPGWGPGWGRGSGPMPGWGPGMTGRWDGARGPMMGGRGPGHRMMGRPGEYIDGRIAFMQAELRLTEAQKPLFDRYAEALRAASAAMRRLHERMWTREMPEPVPDRLQRHIDGMTARLQSITAVKAAVGPLYEALAPDQRETLDDLIGSMGMM